VIVQSNALLNRFSTTPLNRIFLIIVISSVILGVGTGYLLSTGKPGSQTSSVGNAAESITAPKAANQDKSTFRDFAEGTIQKKTAPKSANEYVEGTHVLVRTGAVPVALTSSVVDLSEYEGKKVVVYGETQKAVKEGWLMDVGMVEVKE
jgi:hypothetical protein